ncbi:PREDICTED: uncharacterized protein LOC107192173 isoform X1 [Dufourea novaeangliae]|uniref:uncharacterized protein LOC107192173 isoform X1 n=1 Tax=Dufourea novaeangliae TaxID=178035 RepID=UPI000767B56D|nr:PREDICTED: uncharacterized protein LOC107192173 isoform X1 [Dufourea novaeangliae]
MNAVKFAEEFTQLLCRWTRTVTNEDGSSAPLLTNKQLLKIIQDVIQVMHGVSLQILDYSTITTPTTGIAVCTPTAPVVAKLDLHQNNTSISRFRSLDTLIMLNESNDHKPDIKEEASKNEEKLDIDEIRECDTLPEDRKFISRSSPAIHVSSVARSNTFVYEEDEKNEANRVADRKESNVFHQNETSVCDLQKFLKKVNSLRDCASDILSKIDDLKQDVLPQPTKHIRRLSSMGGFPGVNRTSSLMRSIPPPKPRRSVSDFPGTPTSSKLNPTITTKENIASGRSKSSENFQKPPKITLSNRSPSFSVPFTKKSPLDNIKPSKNPKYAHVQSTIPKASTVTTSVVGVQTAGYLRKVFSLKNNQAFVDSLPASPVLHILHCA